MTRPPSLTFDLPRLRSLRNWIMEAGLCTRPGEDPSRWSPEEPRRNAEAQRRLYEQAAAALCHGCKALTSCRMTAEVEEHQLLLQQGYTPHGIRGGEAPWVRHDRLVASINARTDSEEEAA